LAATDLSAVTAAGRHKVGLVLKTTCGDSRRPDSRFERVGGRNAVVGGERVWEMRGIEARF